jgi:DNA-binding transcriptional ArsR family regulator
MSLGDVDRVRVASLRAMAHPLRLRMLSLLTGAELTAAEVARELGITHANASYHLRQLEAAGVVEVAEGERIRGGQTRRYHYLLGSLDGSEASPVGRAAAWHAVAEELQRRAAEEVAGKRLLVDAELWVDPEVWAATVAAVHAASTALHEAARPPRSPGTVRVSASVGLFPLREQR